MSPTDSFHLAHRAFFGEPPNERHARIYAAFPGARGVSDHEKDETVFEAVLIMALVQTYPRHQRPDPFKCYLFIPASIEKWAVTTLGSCAKRMFDLLKSKKEVKVAQHLGAFFHSVLIGSRVLHLDQEPDRWVCFGFERTDPIPDWMRNALLDRSR